MKPQIFCIVGSSGSGKTTLANHLQAEIGLPTIISYTTRDMRIGETQDVEHHFVSVDQMPPKEDMLAYTFFGGNHYWAEHKDVPEEGAVTYIVDEKGLIMLTDEYWDAYDIKSILVKRDDSAIAADVPEARRNRDSKRLRIDENCYDVVLENNGTLKDFLDTATDIIGSMINVGFSLKR